MKLLSFVIAEVSLNYTFFCLWYRQYLV